LQGKCRYAVGEVLDLPDADYRAIDAISQSGVRMFATEGPWVYYCRQVARTHHTPVTRAMELGRAGHRFLEVGCDVDQVFLVEPDVVDDADLCEKINSELEAKKSAAARLEMGMKLNNRSKAHKQYRELAMDGVEVGDRVIVPSDKLAQFRESVQSLKDNETCRSILLSGPAQCEASIVREDAESGVLFKCRADALFADRIVDYKFTKHRNPSRWKKEARFDGSYFQALYYMQLFKRDKFTWMLISNQSPHESFAVTVRRESLQSDTSATAQFCEHLGRKRSIAEIARDTVESLVDCYLNDEWHHEQWYGESDLEDENW